MLRLIRRHLKACPHSSSLYRRCKCPLHVYGTLGGQRVRKALDLTSWEAATDLIRDWEAAGEIGGDADVPTITQAVEKFLHDLEHGQQRKAPTISKHKNLLEKRLQPWCEARSYTDLQQLDVAAMREFRAGWKDSPITATKNLERLRSFFRFCVDANWLEANPASALKPPKVGKASERVKVFTADEIKRILKACDQYPERNSFGHDNPARVRAFVLTLRYSGLRIGDVVGLRRADLHRDRLFLHTAKTGESVYVPLPTDAVDALKDVKGDGERFFWSGKGEQRSAVGDWQRTLRRVFKDAKVTANPHMFRHTFATDLLARGVPIEDVAILLGHATPAITSKYYAHFVKARRDRLEERIKTLWT